MVVGPLLVELNHVINQICEVDGNQVQRERAARRIQLVLAGVMRRLRLDGSVKTFGSFANGFKSGNSDIDVSVAL